MSNLENENTPYMIGFTSDNTVMLDLDEIQQEVAENIANYADIRFRLGGYIIMSSSPKHFHIIFDKPMNWVDASSVMAKLVLRFSDLPNLNKWFIMQIIKKCATLRVSTKYEKPVPVYVTCKLPFSKSGFCGMVKQYALQYKWENPDSHDSVKLLMLTQE